MKGCTFAPNIIARKSGKFKEVNEDDHEIFLFHKAMETTAKESSARR